jgi:integrase/recombinase XerC
MRKSASANSANAADTALAKNEMALPSNESAFPSDAAAVPPETIEALRLFESELLARGAPETTRRYLAACRTLASARGSDPLATTTWRDAQRALASLHAQGIAPRTLATTLSAWKTWFRVLARHDARFKADAFDSVRVPKPPRRLPSALTESEMTQLLDAQTNDTESEWRDRDRAMFELLYGCGMRVSELAGLNVEHIDFAANEVRAYGKGRKERLLPMGGKARDALQAWMPIRATKLAGRDENALFIGARGGRIATTAVRRALSAAATNAGIASHVHPHRLRHSFASHVLQSSRDLRAVQELMGHASIASTQVYAHLDFQHLASVYDDAHPRARNVKKKT